MMGGFSGTGTIADVRIRFGAQTLRWTLDEPKGTPRNGDRVTVKNSLIVGPERITLGTHALGLHFYSDDTYEIAFAEEIPERNARGEKPMAYDEQYGFQR